MGSHNVNREEQGSHVLSVRLSQREFRRLRATLRNYQIDGSCFSEQLRKFFKDSYWRSIRHARSFRSASGSNTQLHDPGEVSES